jgi:2-isopropylmalate synthase
MAMRVRGDIMPFTTEIDTTKIMHISRRVATVSGFNVQPNKAIVGKNAFAHESGIHQDGMLKSADTFEIMRPEDVGPGGTSLPLGKHSGRAACARSSRSWALTWSTTSSTTCSCGSRHWPTARRRFLTTI